MFKAILFDLDGTLLDTLADIANSMNAVLAANGHPTHTLDKYRYFIGDGMHNLVKRAVPKEFLNDSSFEKYLAAAKAEYTNRWADTSKPYEGIPEMLDEIKSMNLKTVILSNKPDEFTKLTVEKLLLNWHFDIVQGVSDSIPAKPDPKGALQVAKDLELEPKDFLYLGDTNTDMQTANNVGMYAAGVSWGFRDADELLENGAKTIIDHPCQIIELLK